MRGRACMDFAQRQNLFHGAGRKSATQLGPCRTFHWNSEETKEANVELCVHWLEILKVQLQLHRQVRPRF